jgi:hypothetical protein
MTSMPATDLCVYCRRRPVDVRFRPFCSERCRLLDLAAWVDGTYRVAGAPVPREEDRDPPDHEA